MKDNNLIDRAVSASARYCELKGYEVLEQNWSPEGSEESVPLMQSDDEPNFEVRFDIISMMVIGESRAMLKHHINAFSEAA